MAGQLLSTAEVAERFEVTPETVRRWAEAGRIAGFRDPGGTWRFRREDIDRILERQDAQ
jgi:excisionase family DNA binding protein